MRRVFYFAPVATEELNRLYHQQHHIGAAANKVLGVCSALRSVGVFPVVVSGLISFRLGQFSGVASHRRTNGVCFSILFSMGRGLMKRLSSAVSFLVYAVRYVRASDRVILYNFALEFILAASYLRACGRPAILDIEDAPRKDEKGLRGLGNRILLPVFLRLCSKNYLTVSHQIGELHKLRRYLPIYGVPTGFMETNIQPKFSGDFVKILFGGAIMSETGLDLFLEAVRLLAHRTPELRVKFFVTGIFPYQTISDFSNEVASSSAISVTVLSGLSATKYKELAADMDVGLCLKLPSHSMGQTTFPSKIIEYAGMGMLVCSTSVSDVPRLFDDSNAVLLKTETAEELAMAIAECEAKRELFASRARAGRDRVQKLFSRQTVGQDLVEFIYA
jgi:glycosyltransferase involved in cell wall biosynthesis